MVIRVRNDDHLLNGFVRWCADSIVLHRPPYHDRKALVVTNESTLLLDRSATPTRISEPEAFRGTVWYSTPTRFTISAGAHLQCQQGGQLRLSNGSVLHVMPGATLELNDRCKVLVDAGCRIVEHPHSTLLARTRTLKKLRKKGRLVTVAQ
jgi:hypothetical protein